MASSVTPSHDVAHNEPTAAAATNLHHLTPTRSTSGDNPGPPSKRRRINFACDYCRSPAGIQCITRNRRQPWLDVQRHEAGKVPNRTRVDGTTRQNETDFNSTPRVAVASSAILTHEDERGANRSRRSRRQQYPTNDTMNAPASTPLSGNQGLSQAENDDTIVAGPPCSYPSHQARRTSAHRSDTTQGDDERPELRSRLTILQINSGNTPLEFMTSWLDLARYRLQIPRSGPRQTALSNQDPATGIENTQRYPVLPEFSGPWPFPDQEVSSTLVHWFLEGPNVVFPLLKPDKIRHAAQMAFANGPNSFAQQQGLALLMQVYLVMILGYNSRPSEDLDFDAEGCLKYSQSLLGLTLQQSTVETLQAVTLLSMALRCHDNLAAAGHTMSLAVSLAVSLGLPKHSLRLSPGEEKRDVWISVFSYEKFLSFELGRSSLIVDDYPELVPTLPLSRDRERETARNGSVHSHQQQKQPTSEVTLSLASVLSEVGRLCVQVSRKEEDRNDEPIIEIIREKVRTTGLSCMKLMDWAAKSCPSCYSPVVDILFDKKTHPFASFIAMQYHTAMIIVVRNSLLIGEKDIRLSVDVIAKDEPWEFAVRNGQSLAANSARKILRLFLESSENDTYPVLPSLAGPLHAMGVLAVYVVTRQNSIMANMDRELLRAATLAIKDTNTLNRVEKELEFAFRKPNAFVIASAESRMQNGRMTLQRSEAESSALPQGHMIGEQVPTSTWIPSWQAPGNSTSLAQSSGETLSDITSGQMSNMNSLNEMASDWIEDSSPMIMDEFGWNWANFLQLLDGRDVGTQIQL
ncbi:hypothetical protein yc1106_02716 [Curvularia clavata]|uniref:Xylanolytic transcriptional activator regulatory domain-containing protein n=1 Tax=Curvularia clavata TaxID=95742 RepID=A0A9Q9DQC2_CURCL|nr:hypothetical protein yc1106_02716 [Curvularia clavata]